MRFEIQDYDTGQILAVTAGLDDRPPREVDAWIAAIRAAPILSVTGLFRPRPGLRKPDGGLLWRIHASVIRIPEIDDGVPAIRAARAYAQERQGQERRPAPTLREIVLTDLRPCPLRPHRDHYALAFESRHKGQPVALLHPLGFGMSAEEIATLSTSLLAMPRVRATGYFRPEITRGDAVLAWGFVASRCEPDVTGALLDP